MEEGTRTMFHWISACIALPTAAYAGMPFFKSAWNALKKGRANMDVPISLGVLLASGLSVVETIRGGEHAYFDAVAMLLFFLLIGRYLDHALRQKARQAARDLLALQAVTASRLEPDGSSISVAVGEIRLGDQVIILPGDRIPVDGTILEGVSEADFSLLTGETPPVALAQGQAVRAGALNLSGRLVLKASARSEDSFLAEIARLVEMGEQSKSIYIRWADKAAKLYVPVVHAAAFLTAVVWLLLGAEPRVAILNACAVLIITCPCALGLAVPAVQVVASGRLFKRGILLKSGDALERLAEIDFIAFDKTGVLTLGQPKLLSTALVTEAA
jgi:P-type Cu2+ transporter